MKKAYVKVAVYKREMLAAITAELIKKPISLKPI